MEQHAYDQSQYNNNNVNLDYSQESPSFTTTSLGQVQMDYLQGPSSAAGGAQSGSGRSNRGQFTYVASTPRECGLISGPRSAPFPSLSARTGTTDSLSGPSRRDLGSNAGSVSGNSVANVPGGGVGGRNQPYARPIEQHLRGDGSLGPTNAVKASSTTSEFTKRKNWSQHIIDEIQDFMHVLSPTGIVMFATPSIKDLTGWTPEEVCGHPLSDFIHTDDVEGFLRDFTAALSQGRDLTLYYRFRMKDERYIIFEVTGHPYYVDEGADIDSGSHMVPSPSGSGTGSGTGAAGARVRTCKCFFAIGRPYPSKNTAMLDSFLELKTENERLRQELQIMYRDIEGANPSGGIVPGSNADGDYGQDRRSSTSLYLGSIEHDSRTHAGNYNPQQQQQLAQQQQQQQRHLQNQLSPNLLNDGGLGGMDTGGMNPNQPLGRLNNPGYGALGIGISAPNKGDGTAGDKKKKSRVEEGEFVCRDCGTVESPEWRKGPEGPKSLCNACGLRYAKLKSKGDKLAKSEKK